MFSIYFIFRCIIKKYCPISSQGIGFANVISLLNIKKIKNDFTKKQKFLFHGLINNLFDNDFFGMPVYEHAANTLPAVNLIEDTNDFVVQLAVPGFKKSDFNIEIEDNLLSISMERENDCSSINFNRREFNYNSFKRTFNLPESSNMEKISAQYNEGILLVNIPKRKRQSQFLLEKLK